MARYTLSVVDVRGIQGYIFGSNVLRHNLGASELVRRATDDWVRDCLPTPNNLSPGLPPGREPYDDRTIERDSLAAEVVYAGGGNAVVLFADEERAVGFAKALTRKAMLEAPGLDIFVKRAAFDWQNDSAADTLRRVLVHGLEEKKRAGAVSGPLLGLGVTADCQFTGLPATSKDGDGHRVSAEVLGKLDAASTADARLKHTLALDGYGLVRDFDEISTPGESSYLAVVHADGNGMGKRFIALADGHRTAAQNRDYINATRALSRSVDRAAAGALQAVVLAMKNNVDAGGNTILRAVPLRDDKLPFRPIIAGGDDLTFVCDGRLGLWLAEVYLRAFQGIALHDGRPATARAGVAVAKSHFPFARTYALAEELSEQARERVREYRQERTPGGDTSAIDWHFAVSGAVADLAEIRCREYSVGWKDQATLLSRPLTLNGAGEWRSLDVFWQLHDGFRAGYWAERRGKIKELREVLREGNSAAGRFLGPALKELPPVPGHSTTTWLGDRCVYYDAIEALDFFVRPSEGKR